MTAAPTPQLSMSLVTFSAEDPGGWGHLRARAQLAEDAGIDRVVCSDHVAFGENLEAYADPARGGTSGGTQPTGPDGHWLDPLTVLTWIAGFTDRVRLGTNILIAALRRPAVLAKEVATLDVLSGGRVDLGVGVGWQEEEYVVAGLDYASRGKLLDHTLEVCRTLWREQRASFSDDLLSFDGIHQMPKPLQAGGVPIWVSGTVNPRVVRRLARFGSGWIPWGDAADDPRSAIPRMKQALAHAGRADVDSLQVAGTLRFVRDDARVIDPVATAEAAGPLVEAGVTDFRCYFSQQSGLEEVAAVVEAFGAAYR